MNIEHEKQLAPSYGGSTEAEQSEISNMVLQRSNCRLFLELLKRMPNVGEDSDFDRHSTE